MKTRPLISDTVANLPHVRRALAAAKQQTMKTRTPAQQRVFEDIEGMKIGQTAYYNWRYFDAVGDASVAGLCDYEQLRRQRGLPALKVTRIPPPMTAAQLNASKAKCYALALLQIEKLRAFVEECALDRDDRISPGMKRKAELLLQDVAAGNV